MERFIAEFGRYAVYVPYISENNAVKFKLKMNGVTNFSNSVPSITVNEENFSKQVFVNGMNITRIKDSTIEVIETKSFLFNTTDTSINTGFVTYMNSQTTGTVLFVTGKGLKSSQVVDDWFTANGSSAWLGQDIINNYDTAYVGIWNAVDRKIMKEMTYIDDGSGKLSAEMDTIYDTYRDMGACGYPQKLVDDGVTYSGGVGQYEFKRYPTDTAITPLSQFGISTGGEKATLLSVEMMADAATIANGQNCRTTLHWYAGSSLVSSEFIETDVSKPNSWQLKWTEVTIPTNANGFSVVTSRHPSKITGGGTCSVRNVVMALSSTIPKNSKTEFGINGVRTNNLVEGLEPTSVFVLIDANKNVINTVQANTIREINSDAPFSEPYNLTVEFKND